MKTGTLRLIHRAALSLMLFVLVGFSFDAYAGSNRLRQPRQTGDTTSSTTPAPVVDDTPINPDTIATSNTSDPDKKPAQGKPHNKRKGNRR